MSVAALAKPSEDLTGAAPADAPIIYTLAELKTAHLALHYLFCLGVQLSTAPDLSHLKDFQTLTLQIFEAPAAVEDCIPIQHRVEDLMTAALKKAAQVFNRTFADRDVFNLHGFQHRAGMGYIGMDVDIKGPAFRAMGPIILSARCQIEIQAESMHRVTFPTLWYAPILNLGR